MIRSCDSLYDNNHKDDLNYANIYHYIYDYDNDPKGNTIIRSIDFTTCQNCYDMLVGESICLCNCCGEWYSDAIFLNNDNVTNPENIDKYGINDVCICKGCLNKYYENDYR